MDRSGEHGPSDDQMGGGPKGFRGALLAVGATAVLLGLAAVAVANFGLLDGSSQVPTRGSDSSSELVAPPSSEQTAAEGELSPTPLPSPPILPTSATISSRSGSLELEVTIDPTNPLMGQIVRFSVKARDSEGGILGYGGSWGDGSRTAVPGRASVDCAANRTPQPRPAVDETRTKEYAYRTTGIYEVRFVVASAACYREERRTEVRGKIVVGPGLLLSNGPLPPIMGATQNTYDIPDPARTYVGITVEDRDGYVTKVEVDWGDGSPVEATEFALSACNDPIKRWVSSEQLLNPSHRYASSGNYTVTVKATSSGCDGKDVQSTSESITVTA